MSIKISDNMQLSEHFIASELIATSGYATSLITKELKLDYRLVPIVEKLIKELNLKSLSINSGYRTLAQENDLGRRGYYAVGASSPHVKGTAVDVPVRDFTGYTAQEVVSAAIKVGFMGIGVYDWGYHFDVRKQDSLSFWDKRNKKTKIDLISEVPKPAVTYGYSKITQFKGHTDVHIYSTMDIPQVVLGKRNEQEYLTDIARRYNPKCAINCGMFAWDGKTEHYGLLVTDEGEHKEIKDFYQPSSKGFVDMIAWEDGSVSIERKDGYDLEYLVNAQIDAHWGIGTSYALMRKGAKCTLNWGAFAHSDEHHNRTIIGCNTLSKVWYLIVADGRTEWDKGLTAQEEYELCRELEITDACNLDGGGSSDMICNAKVVTGDYRVSRKIGSAVIVA